MELRCCVLLVFIYVVEGNTDLYDQRKFGCLLAPEICIPPEDCDGATGNCRIPFRRKDWEALYEDNLSSLARLVENLRFRGYDVDLDDVIRSLVWGRQVDDDWAGARGTDYFSEIRDVDLFPSENSDVVHKPRELRRSVNSARSVVSPLQTVKVNTKEESNIDSEELEHMKTLVRDAQFLLAKRGKTFKDLSQRETRSLANFLAKILLKDEESKKKIHKKTSQSGKQSGSVGKSVTMNNTDVVEAAQPVSAVEIQQQPAEFEEILVQPRDPNDVGGDTKSPVDSADPPKSLHSEPKTSPTKMDTLYIVIIVVGATVLLIILVTIISCIVYSYRIRNDQNKKFIGSTTEDTTEACGEDYEALCRQHYASKNTEVNDNHREIVDSGSTVQEPLITRTYPVTKPTGNDSDPKHQDAVSVSSYANATRNSSVSSMSWSEEPVTANLDITTGHAVLSYMEDHLTNKDRLDKEWDEICGYEAENVTTMVAVNSQNSRKNRSMLALPYDHNRIKLNSEKNHLHSDYINASAIIDNDPKRPLYIATQGPLPSTIPDFWQMMWEKGCVAIVMLTPLVEEGVNQCARYWPDEGSCTYHNFEIHLVSEHIWCEDYLVRSLYLKHLATGETRTVTQFHFLSWPRDRVPSTPKPLLELRRKVTKCYKGHNSPVLVHCSDGIGRTGTYILLDLAIDRMLKGAKEIDIAATLEHIRDQRVGMVANKEQFEFALTAVAEEVNAILKTLLH